MTDYTEEMPKIESGIPFIPNGWNRNKSKWEHYLKNMRAGDSVFFKEWNHMNSLVAILRQHGKKTATRTVEGGYRVWRLK